MCNIVTNFNHGINFKMIIFFNIDAVISVK